MRYNAKEQKSEQESPMPTKRRKLTIGGKKTQNEDLNFKSIFIKCDYDDFVIHKSSQPFEQNELKQEKESSDVNGCSGLSAKEKLLMLVFQWIYILKLRSWQLTSFKRLAKMNQLQFFFQWIHRMDELKRIEEIWQTCGL